MKQVLIILYLISSLPLSAVCQLGNEDLRTMMIVRDLERESRPFRTKDNGPGVTGDPYYSPFWNKGSVTIYREEKKFELPAIRYDVFHNSVEVQVGTIPKSLDGKLVRSFEYADSVTNQVHRFVNGRDFELDGAPLTGFLEVLSFGKLGLYSYTTMTLLSPNYNKALVAGREDYHISKKTNLLFGSGKTLIHLTKKDLAKAWGEQAPAMQKYQKVNRLTLSSERDMTFLFEYFNGLQN